MLLALDTATDAVTVALHDGTRVVASAHLVVGTGGSSRVCGASAAPRGVVVVADTTSIGSSSAWRSIHPDTRIPRTTSGSDHLADRLRHGELLAPAIRGVLDQAGVSVSDLTRIAVGVGPGPYTGLRIGLVTATSMGTVLDIPVVGVRTPDIVSFEVTVSGPFVVATDARRREVYWARYSSPGQCVDGPHVDLPSAAGTDLSTAGNGPLLYPDAFPCAVEPQLPSAAALACAVTEDRAELLAPRPLYLRRPDASVPAERKRVT